MLVKDFAGDNNVVLEPADPFHPKWQSVMEHGPTFSEAAARAIVKAVT